MAIRKLQAYALLSTIFGNKLTGELNYSRVSKLTAGLFSLYGYSLVSKSHYCSSHNDLPDDCDPPQYGDCTTQRTQLPMTSC